MQLLSIVELARQRMGAEAFDAAVEATRQRELDLLHEFVGALEAGDLLRYKRAIVGLCDDGDGLWPLIAQIVQGFDPARAFREAFVYAWVRYGEDLRGDFLDDDALLDFLHTMLPRYDGQPRKLYRGELGINVDSGEYGLSWTSDVNVARRFAQWGREAPGGTALIETRAPAEAIISRVPRKFWKSSISEREFVVDRRALGLVKAVKRFEQDCFSLKFRNVQTRLRS